MDYRRQQRDAPAMLRTVALPRVERAIAIADVELCTRESSLFRSHREYYIMVGTFFAMQVKLVSPYDCAVGLAMSPLASQNTM